MICRIARYLICGAILTTQGTVFGQDAAPATGATPETIADELDLPLGIAVQPESGDVFVAESGRGRILRYVDGMPQEVAVGFPQETFENEPTLKLGPLGLVFLNNETLLVGGGGQVGGEDVIYVMTVKSPGQPPQAASEAIRLGPLKSSVAPSGGGNFVGLVASTQAVFATSNLTGGPGWIVELEIKKSDQVNRREGFGRFEPFIPAERLVGVAHPAGISLSPQGEIVVGFVGELSETRDSRLAFFRSHDGRLLLNLEVPLYDLVAVGYGGPQGAPTNRFLYALDLAWARPSEAGLFRLDAVLNGGRMEVKAVRIAPLARPVAMTRTLDGSLYVTVLGPPGKEAGKPAGKVLRFPPGL